MKTYSLYRCLETGRLIISEANPGFMARSLSQVNAGSWVDAKRRFGFHLTPIQQSMLSI